MNNVCSSCFFKKVYDKKLQFLEIDFIYPVQCEIFAEFSGEITFGIWAKMAEIITRKLHAWVAPGQTKTTCQKTSSAAWPSWIGTRRQYNPLVVCFTSILKIWNVPIIFAGFLVLSYWKCLIADVKDAVTAQYLYLITTHVSQLWTRILNLVLVLFTKVSSGQVLKPWVSALMSCNFSLDYVIGFKAAHGGCEDMGKVFILGANWSMLSMQYN